MILCKNPSEYQTKTTTISKNDLYVQSFCKNAQLTREINPISQEVTRIFQMSAHELRQMVIDEELTGHQLAAPWKYATALLHNPVHRALCATLTNFTYPQDGGQCFAAVETIAERAGSNRGAFERFMRGIGGRLFDSQRRWNQSAVRTLTTDALRFLLVGWTIIRASLPATHTKKLFAEFTRAIFGEVAKPRRGRPPVDKSASRSVNCAGIGAVNCEGIKDLQDLDLKDLKIKPDRVAVQTPKSKPLSGLIALFATLKPVRYQQQQARWKKKPVVRPAMCNEAPPMAPETTRSTRETVRQLASLFFPGSVAPAIPQPAPVVQQPGYGPARASRMLARIAGRVSAARAAGEAC